MKKTLTALVASGMILFGIAQASATTRYTFDDGYIDAPDAKAFYDSTPSTTDDDYYKTDSIGGSWYNITSAKVDAEGRQLVFYFYSPNDGGYFSIGYQYYGIGDLFLDTQGGTAWNYVVDLTTPTGSPTLYAIDPTHPEYIENGSLRATQAALYNPTGDPVPGSTSGSKASGIDGSLRYLSISIDLSSVWDGSTPLGFHWTMTCGNDVVQDVLTPVPEPTTMLLFATGLAGLAGLGRRRIR